MELSLQENIQRMKRFINQCVYTLVVILLFWLFTPYSNFFAGLFVGLLIGFINWVHIAYRVRRIGHAAQNEQKIPTAGLVTRLSMAALGAIIVLSFPETFSVIGLAVGLILPTIFIVLDAVIILRSEQGTKRKG